METHELYHEGERRVQQRTGEELTAARNSRAISDAMIPGAVSFIQNQTMAVAGSVDRDGNTWASLLLGEPGFTRVADERTLEIDLERAGSHAADPLWSSLDANPKVGLLFIELASRRRFRVNGEIQAASANRLQLSVTEAYPNCPQYIQRRQVKVSASNNMEQIHTAHHNGDELTAAQQALIGSADTFFVASVHPGRGADASHRGGDPGFVRVIDQHTLRVPDYPGNGMFNTLGNFEVYPKAGLAFLDLQRGRILQLTGEASIRWDLEEQPQLPTGGTGRYWDFKIARWIEADLDYRLTSDFLDAWPRNPAAKQRD